MPVTTYAEARRLAEVAFPYVATGGAHAARRGFEDDDDFHVPWQHDDPDDPPVVAGIRASWVFVAKATGRVRTEFPPYVFDKVGRMRECG